MSQKNGREKEKNERKRKKPTNHSIQGSAGNTKRTNQGVDTHTPPPKTS